MQSSVNLNELRWNAALFGFFLLFFPILGLSVFSLRNWEQGKRRPDPAARAYLKVIEKVPDVVFKALMI